jgi:hypothetical protein
VSAFNRDPTIFSKVSCLQLVKAVLAGVQVGRQFTIVCSRSMSKWILWSAAVTDGALI